MIEKKEYKCKYCGRKIHKFDHDHNHGYCGKCKNVVEWKRTLDHVKEFKK